MSQKRHRRGRKLNVSKVTGSNVGINFAFNNADRVKHKIYEIGTLVNNQDIDVMGIVETFLNHDDGITINNFKWIGKNRNQKGGGGIGFLVSNKVCIIDDNLFDSKSDDIERLWIKIDTGNGHVFLAVAYFPVDGTDIERTDELYSHLLSECIRIEGGCEKSNSDPRIIIMTDCNGRIGHHIPDCDDEINANSDRLLSFSEDSGLYS